MSAALNSKRMKFIVYLSDSFMSASIDELDLSVRSRNCLKRAGLFTIGDVLNSIDRQEDLLKYKNLGMSSAREIMQKIFLFHYNSLQDEQKKIYQKRVAELNGTDSFSDCWRLF